jgi:hypothetical protein
MQRRKDGGDSRFTDITASALSVGSEQLLKRSDFIHLTQMKQFLAGKFEVLANRLIDLDP